MATSHHQDTILCRWVGASVSSIGRGHLNRGLPCQDASSILTDANTTIVVVSDGAGSATHSEYGSSLVVKTATKVLRKTAPWENLDFLKDNLLAECRSAIALRAKGLGCDSAALAATLAFVAVSDGVSVAGNLGDGVVVAFLNDVPQVLLGPSRGEFANETVFVTSVNSTEQLHLIKQETDEFNGFALMSDGAADSLYLRHEGTLAPAVGKILSLFQEHSQTEVADAIRYSAMPLLTTRTLDDCSLSVLQRVSIPIRDFLKKSPAFQMEYLEVGNHLGLKNRLKVLFQRDASEKDIVKSTGLSECTVRNHLRALSRIYDA